MNGESGGPGAIVSRVFYGAAALFATTFAVAAILEGYEAEAQMREENIFSPLGITFLTLAVVSFLVGLLITLRNRQ